jgi:hypothetical protein
MIAGVVVIFTGFASGGFGEHCFIGLIVSMPVVMIVYGLCAADHKLTAIEGRQRTISVQPSS